MDDPGSPPLCVTAQFVLVVIELAQRINSAGVLAAPKDKAL